MWNKRNLVMDPIDLGYDADVKPGMRLTTEGCHVRYELRSRLLRVKRSRNGR